MTSWDPGTWICHVCKKERPDAAISVYKTVEDMNGITVQQNVRYCNDDPACIAGAPDIRFFTRKGTP